MLIYHILFLPSDPSHISPFTLKFIVSLIIVTYIYYIHIFIPKYITAHIMLPMAVLCYDIRDNYSVLNNQSGVLFEFLTTC